MDDTELDDLFRAAKAAAPAPSDALVARVLADAAAAQPRPAVPAPRPAPQRGGWFSRLGEAFGGRGVLAGLAATAVAGVAIGFWGPALTASWPAGAFASGTVELFPDPDTLLSAMEEQG